MSLNLPPNPLQELQAIVQSLQGSKQYAGLPWIAYGQVPASGGWVHVSFSSTAPNTPIVLATQTPATPSPQNQTLSPPTLPSPSLPSPPQLQAPQIQAPSLAPLQVPQVSPPAKWGDYVSGIVAAACSVTLGKIPYIGGLCDGISYIAIFLAVFANGLQSLYYAIDLPALIANITQAVEAKTSEDWNNGISKVQDALNKVVSDANAANASIVNQYNSSIAQLVSNANASLSQLTETAQNAVNALFTLINQAVGLPADLAIPVAQVRNVTTTGFDVYAVSQVFWVALAAPS